MSPEYPLHMFFMRSVSLYCCLTVVLLLRYCFFPAVLLLLSCCFPAALPVALGDAHDERTVGQHTAFVRLYQ
jgi:hypothetical protein